MGEDITFRTSPYDFRPVTREQEQEEHCIFAGTSLINLFPLLCFRHYDLKIMISDANDDSREKFCPELRYVVPFDLAIKQLLAGVEVLKQRFTNATVLDRYVPIFINLLMRKKNQYLHLECIQFAHMMEFDLLLHHALLGIQYPDMKMYYSPDQIQRWDYWQKPAENGIMSWSGALRRLTRIGALQTEGFPDEEELFIPSDTNDGYFDLCILGFYPSGPF